MKKETAVHVLQKNKPLWTPESLRFPTINDSPSEFSTLEAETNCILACIN